MRRSIGSRACSHGGEDPRYIARRLVRFASEDVGMADPQALVAGAGGLGVLRTARQPGRRAGHRAGRRLSRHRAEIERALCRARARRAAAAKATGSLMPPAHILNAPTRLMKELGYGAGYAYDHAEEEAFSGAELLPRRHGARGVLPPAQSRLRAGDRASGWRIGRSLGRSASVERRRPARSTRTRRISGSTAGSAAIFRA